MLLCAVVLAVFWQRAREDGRNSACIGRLHEIGFLLRNYHAVHGTYPPSPDEVRTDAPAVTWRVLVLRPTGPDLDAYDLAQAWSSAQNEQFLRAPYGKSFWCPSDSGNEGSGTTSYLAVVGKGTVWSEVRLGHIRSPDKEVPQKIVVIEVPHSGVYWTEPRDISAVDATMLFRRENGLKHSRHRRGLHYLTADGSVHSFDEIGNVEEFASLIRVAD